MSRSRFAGYLIGALLSAPGLAQELQIQVNVFDYAETPEPTLDAAKKIAGRVLASAGMTTSWVEFSGELSPLGVRPLPRPKQTTAVLGVPFSE